MNNRLEIAKNFAKAINNNYIKKIILFGSVARGEDNKDSDINILIISNHEDKIDELVCDEAFKIVLTKQEFISPHIMSEKKIQEIHNFSLMQDIMREGIVLK